jgi:hypothetical protein
MIDDDLKQEDMPKAGTAWEGWMITAHNNTPSSAPHFSSLLLELYVCNFLVLVLGHARDR